MPRDQYPIGRPRPTIPGMADYRLLPMGLLLTSLLLTHPPWTRAQSSNGTLTLLQETLVTGGGVAGGGNPVKATTAFGESMGGIAANSAMKLFSGYQPMIPGIRFISAGDSSVRVIERGPVALVTGASLSQSHPTLSGTKSAGTSLWINGVEVVALNKDTTWSAIVPLVEGDNIFVIIVKDASGSEAGTTTLTVVVTVVLDTLPPVLSVTAPPVKTNLSPIQLSGTVDDSLTQVRAKGLLARRSGTSFQVDVPLVVGSNEILVNATSPNGYVSTKTISVIRGTIPSIVSTQPSARSKLYARSPLTIQATATDAQADSIEYQFLRNAQVLRDWAQVASTRWTPSESDLGRQSLEVRVRDAFGGENSQGVSVYIVRQPVVPP